MGGATRCSMALFGILGVAKTKRGREGRVMRRAASWTQPGPSLVDADPFPPGRSWLAIAKKIKQLHIDNDSGLIRTDEFLIRYMDNTEYAGDADPPRPNQYLNLSIQRMRVVARKEQDVAEGSAKGVSGSPMTKTGGSREELEAKEKPVQETAGCSASALAAARVVQRQDGLNLRMEALPPVADSSVPCPCDTPKVCGDDALLNVAFFASTISYVSSSSHLSQLNKA
ncbi:hypothetical protein C8R47DRAFT_1204372 [Mycena vitilis]|nr:hypothetical protein C8R47DRAFT_1204372 [Mycena vitilis]